jgi:leucyl aminopeptidase
MAGVWCFEKATEFTAEGASGYGVRLLTAYLVNLAKAKKG